MFNQPNFPPPLDSPGAPLSGNAHELFRGFSFVAPQLIEEISLKSRDDGQSTSGKLNSGCVNVANVLNSPPLPLEARKILSSGVNATGFVKSLSDFDFYEELGRGTFSKCVKGVHRETGKQYAVKVGKKGFLNIF